MADFSDLNPAFAQRLAQFRAALDAAGIKYGMESGYRSPEQQSEIYARSHQGRDFAAAPPWQSFHNYGLAADIIPSNPADYERMWGMAPQYGLKALGAFDKPHFQLAGALPELISQYHLANWRPESQPAPATGAIAYAGPSGQPSRVASTTPGTTINSSPMDIVLNAESGNRNVANTSATTSSGQAQGYPQITTGTWNDFAPKAGVDLKQYPTPLDAPRDVQIKVASAIPLNRWAPSTVNAVLAKYPGTDTSQPLGAIQSAAITPSGASTMAAGGPPAGPATGPKQALPGFQAGSPAEKSMLAAAKTLGIDGSGQEDQPPQMPAPPPIPPAQAMGGMMMLGPGGQNAFGQRAAQQWLAAQGFLTQPSLASFYPQPMPRPVGSPPPGTATGMPSMPGTTLNSPSQLQMALMTGSMNPYDLYANAAAYGGGLGSA